MDVQEILNRNSFLEDEVHRCYAEIEDYEVKTKEFENCRAREVVEQAMRNNSGLRGNVR